MNIRTKGFNFNSEKYNSFIINYESAIIATFQLRLLNPTEGLKLTNEIVTNSRCHDDTKLGTTGFKDVLSRHHGHPSCKNS